MKKILLIISILITSLFCYTITSAQLTQKKISDNSITNINFTAYLDYLPLSTIHDPTSLTPSYEGIFDTFLKDWCQNYKLNCSPFSNGNYEETVKKTSNNTFSNNKLDVIIGAYSDSKLYEDYKLIYPSILDNPVHLVMLPSSIAKISKISDLKPLKGAIDSHDQWNDFVLEQFTNLNITTVDSPEELYRQLMSGEIDYVFTTYWYGMSKIMELGLQDHVSVSQKPIWNMPLFVAVSKTSRYKNFLTHYLTEELKKEDTISKVKERAIEKLEEIKQKTQGTVPEAYILKKDDN